MSNNSNINYINNCLVYCLSILKLGSLSIIFCMIDNLFNFIGILVCVYLLSNYLINRWLGILE